jgi:hypothetical protein
MSKLVPVVAALLLTLGCNSNRALCEDVQDAEASATEKSLMCLPEPLPEEFNLQQCEEQLEHCSEQDKKTFADYADCVQHIPGCQDGDPDPMIAAYKTCLDAVIAGLSRECKEGGG